MRNIFGSTLSAVATIVVVLSLSGCGYNDLQRQDEQIKSAWSEVLNQYQRRADLVDSRPWSTRSKGIRRKSSNSSPRLPTRVQASAASRRHPN